MILSLILSTCFTCVSFAGTKGSIGDYSPGHGGSSEDQLQCGIGIGRCANGIQWIYNNGNVDWSSNLNYEQDPFSAPAIKWACVQKWVNEGSCAGWNNFTWQWWFHRGIDSPGYTQNTLGYYSQIWNDGSDGILQDPDLVEQATNDGYYYDEENLFYSNHNSDDKLDVVM